MTFIDPQIYGPAPSDQIQDWPNVGFDPHDYSQESLCQVRENIGLLEMLKRWCESTEHWLNKDPEDDPYLDSLDVPSEIQAVQKARRQCNRLLKENKTRLAEIESLDERRRRYDAREPMLNFAKQELKKIREISEIREKRDRVMMEHGFHPHLAHCMGELVCQSNLNSPSHTIDRMAESIKRLDDDFQRDMYPHDVKAIAARKKDAGKHKKFAREQEAIRSLDAEAAHRDKLAIDRELKDQINRRVNKNGNYDFKIEEA